MATALNVRDVTAAAIDTTRGSNVDSWEFTFTNDGEARSYGDIYDNADSFSHDTAEGSDVALMITVRGDTETVAILDMDFITITYVDSTGSTANFVIWLPALAGNDDLYVDTDGNTWYDLALTTPAGGVGVFSDSLTLAEVFFSGSDWLTDTITMSDAIASQLVWEVLFSDTITMIDVVTTGFQSMHDYFTDRINLRDGFSDDKSGDFTEDTQSDFSWTEV